MRLLIALVFMVCTFTPVYAHDFNNELCTAGGYYSGAQNHFISGLVMRIRFKRGLLDDKKCTADWAYAYNVGEYFSRNGKFKRPKDEEVARQASRFSSRVYDSILKNMQLP